VLKPKNMRNLRKTYYMAAIDEMHIETIRTRHGLSTASDAVRFAVRLVSEGEVRVKRPKKTDR
jgi:hypothetical protein